MTKREVRHLCNLLRQCFNTSERFVKKVRFENNNQRHFAIAGYAVRTLDYMSGVISALSKSEYSSVPTITRSGVEAFLFFVNLIKHDQYNHFIHLHLLTYKLRQANDAQQIDGLRAETSTGRFAAHKARVEAEIASLSNYEDGYNRLCSTIKKRFEAADMGELYLSMYSIFCDESHSGMMAVESGNMTGDEFGWFFRRSKSPNSDILLYVHVLLDLLIAIPGRLNDFFELNLESDLETIQELIDNTKCRFPLP
jgi:hypothetical protein